MSAQPALRHMYLSVIAAAGIGGLISVGGSYLMNKPINETLTRHEVLLNHHSELLNQHSKLLEHHSKLLEHHSKLLEHQGKLVQETNEKLNEVHRMLRKKTRCFMI